MTTLTCPACGPAWRGEYTTDHRCADCTSILHGESQETEIQRLKRVIREVRNYAGDKLPAQEGLVIVDMLERGVMK